MRAQILLLTIYVFARNNETDWRWWTAMTVIYALSTGYAMHVQQTKGQ